MCPPFLKESVASAADSFFLQSMVGTLTEIPTFAKI